MKTLPDGFGVAFAWALTVLMLVLSISRPDGVYVNEGLKFFPLLLAVAWTSGYLGIKRLKLRHNAEFERLGQPQLFGSPFEVRTWRFHRYVFSFGFLRQGDLVLSACFLGFLLLSAIGIFWICYGMANPPLIFWRR